MDCSGPLWNIPAKKVVWPLKEHFGDGLASETLGGPLFDHLSPHSWSHCNVTGWVAEHSKGDGGKNCKTGQPSPVA